MKMSNQKRETVKNVLIDNLEDLHDLLNGAGGSTKATVLRMDIETLKLGYVHIGLVGQTSSGKSTVINAIGHDIVVPENPMTATPIPTYIAYADDDADTDVVRVLPEDTTLDEKKLTRHQFLTQYCYNSKDQMGNNSERLRYKDDKFAVVYSKSDFLDKGTVLLDTLGSGATEFDDLKTRVILDGDVDLLVYVVGQNMLSPSDIAFLQCNILGFKPGEDEIKKLKYDVQAPLLSPDKLIILGNEKNEIFKEGLIKSVSRIFNSTDCKMSEEEKIEFYENNVWVANALYARLDKAGFYDYSENAPLGSSDKYLEEIPRMNNKQKRWLGDIEDGLADDELNRWNEFSNHLDSVCDDMLNGEDSIVMKKCNRCISHFEDAKSIFSAAIEKLKDEQADYADNINKLDDIVKSVTESKEQVTFDVIHMREGMISCVENCTITNAEELIVSRYGSMIVETLKEKSETVPTNLVSFNEFIDMTSTNQINRLKPVLTPILEELLSGCGIKTRDYLWSLSGSDSKDIVDDVPIKHYKKFRKYLDAQVKVLSGIIKKMEAADVSVAGIVLPNNDELETVGKDLEKKIMKAIEQAFDSVADMSKWTKLLSELLPRIWRQNVFASIGRWFKRTFGGGYSQQQFWNDICVKLIPQLTQALFIEAMGNIKELIRVSVEESYTISSDSIKDIYAKIKNDATYAQQRMKALNTAEEKAKDIKMYEGYINRCNNSITSIKAEIEKKDE